MTEIVFKDNDTEYLKWIQTNPNGYVLNSYLNFSSKYLPLHRANCHTITVATVGTTENAFTGGQYIKICSNNRLDLENWINAHGGKYFSKLCKKCKPMVTIDEIDSQIKQIIKTEHIKKYEPAIPEEKIISGEKIQFLYDKYFELVRSEVVELGVKPTEVRHLIGRLGEFYCALKVNGALAHTPNQHGFDVICENGRRVSVKTTAQKSGFIPISSKTIHFVDDLMIIQYIDGELSTVYYGDVKKAIEFARFYEHVGNYELDISKAKKLMYGEP